MTTVNLIWAQALNGVIGIDNKLPWSIPEDLQRFRNLTRGKTVIMGRKTWDSLPESVRPLPGRRNIVVTRQQDWSDNGVEVVHSLEDYFKDLSDEEEVWVIGGGEVYTQALPYADTIYVTYVEIFPHGDAEAPSIPNDWEVKEHNYWQKSTSGIHYRFMTYQSK